MVTYNLGYSTVLHPHAQPLTWIQSEALSYSPNFETCEKKLKSLPMSTLIGGYQINGWNNVAIWLINVVTMFQPKSDVETTYLCPQACIWCLESNLLRLCTSERDTDYLNWSSRESSICSLPSSFLCSTLFLMDNCRGVPAPQEEHTWVVFD